MNFFDWVRVGVKRSVLAGFADAVETIGVPPESSEQTQQLLESLRENTAALVAAPAGKPSNSRKRLGRTLSNMRPNAEGSA
jgi:hypothetical protein